MGGRVIVGRADNRVVGGIDGLAIFGAFCDVVDEPEGSDGVRLGVVWVHHVGNVGAL